MRFFAIYGLAILLYSKFSFGMPRFNTGNSSKSKETPLEWKELLDPKGTEFWKEGNHIPDLGFLIFAKNPTIENAKYWLMRNEIKAVRQEQMMALVDRAKIELIQQNIIKDRYGDLDAIYHMSKNKTLNTKKYDTIEYFLLFTSNCPYCELISQELRKLKVVIPLQADKQKLKHFKGLPKSSYADESTKKEYLQEKVFPTLLIHDPKTKNVVLIKGYQKLEKIIEASNVLISQRGGK